MMKHKTSVVAAVIAAMTLLSACTTYEAKPLDAASARRAFLARTVDEPSFALDGFQASDGLSLREAEVIALVFNRELRAARLEAGVTRATADNAGLWTDPTLGVDLSQVIGGVSGGVEALASFALTLPLSGRLELERATASAEHRAELARVARDEWRVVAQVRRLWIRGVALTADLSAAREHLERVGQVLTIVEHMEVAGELPRIEARLLHIERAKLEVALAARGAEIRRVSQEMEALLGLAPRSEGSIEADFRSGFACAEGFAKDDDASLLARAESANPSLLLAYAQYEVAEQRLALEIRAQWPDLFLAPGFGEQDGDRQAVLGVGVTLPIFSGNRQGIAEADAARETARGQTEAELERVLGELTAAQSRRAAARAQRGMIETTLLPLVSTQYAESKEVARLGEVDTLLLLESMKQQDEARRLLTAACRDDALAGIDLEELAGPVTPARRAEGTTP